MNSLPISLHRMFPKSRGRYNWTMKDKLPITYEQMRSLVIEALPSSGDLGNLSELVAGLAVKRGFTDNPETERQRHTVGLRHVNTGFLVGSVSLCGLDNARVQDIFWDLVIEGIVRPGLNDGANYKLPCFHVSEYGQSVLKNEPRSPYDPDGYLKRIGQITPKVDEVIVTYLTESLRTFRIGWRTYAGTYAICIDVDCQNRIVCRVA